MSLPAKRCGRPPVLSFLEKKKRKQSLDRRRGKTRIYVGNHIDRWLTLKEKLDFRNDAEVAGFLLDLYDSYGPLSGAPVCSLPEGVRRITVKEESAVLGSTSLIAADGTYDSGDQLCKEPSCSELGDGRIVTVKEEREVPRDCMSTEADDTLYSSEAEQGCYRDILNRCGIPIQRSSDAPKVMKGDQQEEIKLLRNNTGHTVVHFDFAVRVL